MDCWHIGGSVTVFVWPRPRQRWSLAYPLADSADALASSIRFTYQSVHLRLVYKRTRADTVQGVIRLFDT